MPVEFQNKAEGSLKIEEDASSAQKHAQAMEMQNAYPWPQENL
jgi:hypothetical protein